MWDPTGNLGKAWDFMRSRPDAVFGARALTPWQGRYRSWPVSEKWYHFHPMRTHPVAIAPVPGCR